MLTKASGYHRFFAILSLCACFALIVRCTSSEREQTDSESEEVLRASEDVPELADAMGQLQYYTHKYALAVEAENHELATFYFHEVQASADGIKNDIPGYDGYDIARFMGLFLDPTIEPVETALANKDWEEVRAHTIDMVNSCNSCHNATSYGFVQVTPGFENNPYNQDFSGPE